MPTLKVTPQGIQKTATSRSIPNTSQALALSPPRVIGRERLGHSGSTSSTSFADMTAPLSTDVPGSTDGASPFHESSTGRPESVRFTLQEELFIFCCLMLVTCFFLPWQATEKEDTPWSRLFSAGSPVSAAGWCTLLVLYVVTLLEVFHPRIRPWFGIATAVAVNLALLSFGLMPGSEAYGAKLARVFALGLLVLSANPAIVKAGDLAMRRLNSRKAEVFTHFGTVLPGIQFSAQEFYTKLENEIRVRQWPGVEFLRVVHSEAGLLSHKREYLRVVRQRQVFDVCAANFGRDYFFTLREAEIKAQLTLATLFIFLLALAMAFAVFISTFGFIGGIIYFGTFLVIGIFLLFNVLRMGLTRLDGLLMRAPVIGPIYETFFRRSTTYFQHAARMVFLKLMDDLVKEHVDEETSAKGVQLLSCFEHQPILDGLYKTSTRTPKTSEGK